MRVFMTFFELEVNSIVRAYRHTNRIGAQIFRNDDAEKVAAEKAHASLGVDPGDERPIAVAIGGDDGIGAALVIRHLL